MELDSWQSNLVESVFGWSQMHLVFVVLHLVGFVLHLSDMWLEWSFGAWPVQLEGFRSSFYFQGFYFVLHYYLADNTCEINEAIFVSTEPAMENMSLKVAEFEGFYCLPKGSLSKFWPGELASGVLG